MQEMQGPWNRGGHWVEVAPTFSKCEKVPIFRNESARFLLEWAYLFLDRLNYQRRDSEKKSVA